MSVLCGTEMNELHTDGDRHDGSHLRVFFLQRFQSSSFGCRAGPSDEHCYICAVWSCDEPYTTMIFEGRCFRNFV